MANTLKIKRGLAASIPQGQLAEPLFTTDTYDLYIGKGAGGNQRIQNYIASGTSSQFLKGDGTLDSTTYQATSEKGQNNGYASLDAGGKIPAAQLPSSVIEYKGTWNASTNTPTLADGTGDAGDVYIVSVGGTQNLGSGSITFDAGDWVMYNGSIWQKSTGSNAVASVNGQTGIVVLDTDDISEPVSATNLWFTNARARTAISLTTTGTSGAATYDNSTGVLNIPQYQSVLTNPVTGTGTTNYIPKWTSSSALGDSAITDDGTTVTLVSRALSGTSATFSSDVRINGLLGINAAPSTFYALDNRATVNQVTSGGTFNSITIGNTTTTFRNFWSQPIIAAGGIVTNYIHFFATQGTLNSVVPTNQYGFVAESTLTGATNNFGFYGNIASGTNRWNLYMNGTANNYMAGSLGIGSTSLTGYNLRVNKNLTGSVSTTGIQSGGAIQSDVTSDAQYFSSSASTAAASFTITDLAHFIANQGTFGAGSTVTKQYGFRVAGGLTGATNNYAFFSDIASGANRWNLYMNGTANNYMAGNLGIGNTSVDSIMLRISRSFTSTLTGGILLDGQISSTGTGQTNYLQTTASTAAAAFTAGSIRHINIQQGTFGAGSTVTNQFGVFVGANMIGATSNYGFFGDIPSGTNRWNIYMNGTADNYMAGSLGIGTTSLTGYTLRLSKSITGSTSSFAARNEGVVLSDVTADAIGFRNDSNTQAAAFTLTNYWHFWARQGSIGAGSAITNQYGYYVDSNIIGATNNYGFYGAIPSGANRWNLYMNGTASNYLAGKLLIGSTTDSGEQLQVTGTAKITGRVTAGNSMLLGEIQSSYSIVETTAGNGIWLRPAGITSPGGLFVTTGGSVGIGTASPGVKLRADSSDADYATIIRNSNASGYGLQILTQGSGTNLAFQVRTNNTGTNAFQVLDNGSVGIGTTSPNYQLQIHSSTSISRIQLTNSSTGTASGDGFQIQADGVNGILSLPEIGYLRFETSDTERMRITSGGNLLFAGNQTIGVNTADGSDNKYLAIAAGGDSATSRGATIYLSGNERTGAEGLLSLYAGNASGGNITFHTGADTERIRITSGGEVLINTTTDNGAYYLQVNGSVYATAYYESSDIRLKDVLNNSYSENFSAIEFMWKDKRDDKKHWGYAAQDVMKYIPDAIEVNNDGMMTVNYNEAHTWKIAQLEKEILELKAKLK